MKGQYLAVESVITIGMGLSLAIGTISVFGSYQDHIFEISQDRQVENVKYKMHNAIYQLKYADSGTAKVDLPDKVGGVEYTVALGDDLRIITAEEEYSTPLSNIEDEQLRGSSKGGEVILYKSENQYILRSS